MGVWKKFTSLFMRDPQEDRASNESWECIKVCVTKRFACGDLVEYILYVDKKGVPLYGTSRNILVTAHNCPNGHDHAKLYNVKVRKILKIGCGKSNQKNRFLH